MENNNCLSCGMPIQNKADLGMSNEEGSFCKYCITSEKKVRSCDDIFNGGVQFFMKTIPKVDKAFAERIVRKNMNNLPYWKGNVSPCLRGPAATDEEYQNILKKLA